MRGDLVEYIAVGITTLSAVIGIVLWIIKQQMKPLEDKISMLEKEVQDRTDREARHFEIVMEKLDKIEQKLSDMAKDYISAEELSKEQSKCPARRMVYNKLNHGSINE